MANNVIELVIKVTDQASGALKGFTSKLGGLKGAIAGIGVGVGIAAITKNIIEAERSTLKLDVAFRNMGKNVGVTRKQLDQMSTSLQQTTTANDDAIKEAQALLLSFDRVTGTVFERTIRVANDMSVALGTDVVSATQKLGLALQSPADGLSRLSRSGVKLSKDMEEVIKKLAESGQTAKAQELLLAELEKRFGGVATAARNTLGGALEGLKNQVDELFEGDSSSFGGATASINEFSKSLTDPQIKEGIDTGISGLANLAKGLAAVSAALLTGSKLWAEYFASLGNGGNPALSPFSTTGEGRDNPIIQLNNAIERNASEAKSAKTALENLQRAKRVTGGGSGIDEDISAAQTRYNALLSEGATLTRAYAAAQGELRKLIDSSPLSPLGDIPITAKRIDTTGADESSRIASEEAAKAAAEAASKLASLRSSTLAGLAKTFNEWRQSENSINEALRSKAISADEARASIDALNASIRAAVLPTELTSFDAFRQKQDEISAALQLQKITAEEAQAALIRLREDAVLELLPATKKAAIEWERLEQAIRAAGLSAEDTEQSLKELLDKNLEDIAVTTPRIVLTPAKKEVNEFSKQAARNIQDAFADAFLSIGQSSDEVWKKMLDGFRNLLAQMAAAKLAEVLGLDDVIAGRTSDKPVGGILGTIFGSGKRETSSGDPGVDGSIVAGDDPMAKQCTATIGSEGIATLGAQVSGTIGEALKGFGTNLFGILKTLTGGLWKFITQTLGKIWELIKAAISAMQGMASSGGGSGGGGWVGAAMNIVGAFFGASAGGGQIGRGKPRLVGEEGPELIMPMANMKVMNERQAAFAGGGAALTYAPVYNTVFEKAQDDQAMASQFATFVTRNDEKTKREIMEMMRRNGFGRLTR